MKTVSNTVLFFVIPLVVFGVLAGFRTGVQENGDFSFGENDSTLTIYEHNQPVLSIVHGRMDPPEGIDSKYWRSNYIHPIFGLDGEKLTEDFPEDHPHHRGLFWTWPDVTFGTKSIDPWALDGARQLFRKWYHKEAGEEQATISFESGWRLDEGWKSFVEEFISITIHKSDEIGRSIDFTLRFQNVSAKEVTLRGRGETGYGGFNIRPVGSRPGNKITTAEGVMEDDALVVDSGWADYSSLISDDTYAGLSVFQHPGNPGFPHSGWILRHYGFLGASWPQYERLALNPGQTFELKYRVFVHRGDADLAGVEKKFENFVRESSP
ncbi:Methane oxygenase PmoA [Fodinibius roseus]|uniref:Methane oxygenase PmoA n=1 Tax=Fodinibius roseus TaxID=1194090 RepID=A0A1M4TPG3_9BACT|nr:PmoA family protein [Fodinibius roseus]SHE46177.1 Methane oxygenase PmoA [Fodinibius roseus]